MIDAHRKLIAITGHERVEIAGSPENAAGWIVEFLMRSIRA